MKHETSEDGGGNSHTVGAGFGGIEVCSHSAADSSPPCFYLYLGVRGEENTGKTQLGAELLNQ